MSHSILKAPIHRNTSLGRTPKRCQESRGATRAARTEDVRCSRTNRDPSLIAILCAIIGAYAAITPQAAIAEDEVTLTIERIEQLECVDDFLWWCISDGDFYAKIVIDAASFETSPIGDTADISPNWQFRRATTTSSFGIRVEIWDSDGWPYLFDDHVDIASNDGRSLDLTLDLSGCTISGTVSGSCGATLVSSGTSDDRARIHFRVDVLPMRLGEVEVIIERLSTLDCVDNFLWWCPSAADYYGRIAIDGTEHSNGGYSESTQFDDQDDDAPYWRFLGWVNLNHPTIPLDINLMDSDVWFDADDTVDVQPGRGRVLQLDLDPAACTLTGEATGHCGDILNVPSRIDVSGDEAGRARMQMRVRVYRRPRLYVSCVHSPIWPQPGDTVEFRAETLDANMRPVLSDRIELRQPAGTASPVGSCSNASICEVALKASGGGTFSYACSADESGIAATTGSRSSTIGAPRTGRAVPVLQHRPTASAMDFVFIPDSDNYSGASDPGFKNDVHSVIRDAFLSDELFLRNQSRLNFWIAPDLGNAHEYSPGSPSCHTKPANWAVDYLFADTGVLLHTDDLRDCAEDNIFSSEPTAPATVRHEAGHKPFGLVDEYCCDGGYFHNAPDPNIYGPDPPGSVVALRKCLADPLAKLRDSCIGFVSEVEHDNGGQFYRLDHAPASKAVDIENDRMLDNKVPRAGDERRIQALINLLP